MQVIKSSGAPGGAKVQLVKNGKTYSVIKISKLGRITIIKSSEEKNNLNTYFDAARTY